MKSIFGTLFLLLFLPLILHVLPLSAQTEMQATCPPQNVWTLAQLLDTALKNNPETRAAWWNAQRAASALGSAKSAYYPQLALNANISHGRDFRFINGPNVNYTNLEADILMTLLLADFGERAANVEMAMMGLLAAGWETQWSIQSVMAQVLENGYLTHLAQETLEAFEASLEDAKKMLEIAETLNRAGLNPVSDVYSSKAALAQIQIDVVRQRAQLEIQRATLATTLALEPDTCLRLASLNALNVPQRSLLELQAIAKCRRQDLLAKRARLAEVQAYQKKVETSYNPKITLNGAGGGDHALHDKASGAHYRIALNFDAPLFTGFDATYQKRMAFADVKISSEELYKLELDIALEVFTQSRTVEAAKEMLIFAKDNLENARAAYTGSLEKYNAGKERIAEVSITLRQLVNARVSYSETNSGYLIAIANLAFATGTLCPYMESPCAKN